MITHAAVVPLHYGPGHLEFNIIIVGNHYDDLVRLLTDPQSVLFAERTSNKCPGGIPPRFDDAGNQSFPYDPLVLETMFPPSFWMEAPITAIIRHGYSLKRERVDPTKEWKVVVTGFREDGESGLGMTLGGLSTSAQMALLALETFEADCEDVIEPETVRAQRSDITNRIATGNFAGINVEGFAQFFQSSLYKNGGFYCEFAVSTRTLNIIYFRSHCGKGSYSGSITDVTMCKPTTIIETKAPRTQVMVSTRGTAHFDLIPKSPLVGFANPGLRAEFIGQVLEYPWRILELAQASGEYLEAQPRYTIRGKGFLTIDPPTLRKEPLPLHLEPTVFPDVIADGLSMGPVADEAELEPCTVLEWREVPPGSGNYMWVKVVVKVYEDSLPPPEIDAHMAPGTNRPTSWEMIDNRSPERFRPIRRPRVDFPISVESVSAESDLDVASESSTKPPSDTASNET